METMKRGKNQNKRGASYPDKICYQCNSPFNRTRFPSGSIECPDDYAKRKYCSRKCYSSANINNAHWNWKGGVKIRPDGYWRDSKTDQYIHRQVMEQILGRTLSSHEHVHHKDGNPSNNHPTNLALTTNSMHRKYHARIQKRDKKGSFSRA